jgi:hypothetical protein
MCRPVAPATSLDRAGRPRIGPHYGDEAVFGDLPGAKADNWLGERQRLHQSRTGAEWSRGRGADAGTVTGLAPWRRQRDAKNPADCPKDGSTRRLGRLRRRMPETRLHAL